MDYQGMLTKINTQEKNYLKAKTHHITYKFVLKRS